MEAPPDVGIPLGLPSRKLSTPYRFLVPLIPIGLAAGLFYWLHRTGRLAEAGQILEDHQPPRERPKLPKLLKDTGGIPKNSTDNSEKPIVKELRSEVESSKAERESSQGYKSYDGQSDLEYCLECISGKHIPEAITLTQEAIDRSLRSGQGVDDKMRAVVRTLAGTSDDFPSQESLSEMPAEAADRFRKLQSGVREVRKKIWAKRLTRGASDKRDLEEIRRDLESLEDLGYEISDMLPECEECMI